MKRTIKFSMDEKSLKTRRQVFAILTIVVLIATILVVLIFLPDLVGCLIVLNRDNKEFIADHDMVKRAVRDIVILISATPLYILSSELDDFWSDDKFFDKNFFKFLLRK